MNSLLDRVTDWPERARTARFRIATLARDCGVSVRQLRNYIHIRFGTTPHCWTMRIRLLAAPSLLSQNKSVKQISSELGFSQAAHFSREFKRFYGRSPVEFRRTYKNTAQAAENDMKFPI